MKHFPWPTFDRVQRLKEVQSFFARIADQYDVVHDRSYWAFSDILLWKLLEQHVFDRYKKTADPMTLLDAGAGSARWTMNILDYLPTASATLFDISPAMLEVAKKNIVERNLQNRTSLMHDDIEECTTIKGKTFDLVTCLYNVIGFNTNPEIAITNLAQAVREDGTLVLVLPNYYHAIYFSLQHNRMQEIERIRKSYSVRYADQNPEILLFTPTLIASLLMEHGFTSLNILGFPISIYPEFRGDTPFHFAGVENSDTWDTLIDHELHFCSQSEAAARGKNLLVIARR